MIFSEVESAMRWALGWGGYELGFIHSDGGCGCDLLGSEHRRARASVRRVETALGWKIDRQNLGR